MQKSGEPMLTVDLEDAEEATTEWSIKMLNVLAEQLGVGNDFYFPLLGVVKHLELEDAAPRQAEGWQKIETAPKDGRLLLLYCDYGDGESEMYIAHYVIPIAPGGKFGPFIWKTQGSGGVAEKIPTHWMPLPEPPALCGGNGGWTAVDRAIG